MSDIINSLVLLFINTTSMNKTMAGVVIGVIVVAGSAFYGGMQYEKGQVPVVQTGSGAFARGTGGTGGGRGAGGGGFTTGSIISNDGSSITIQMQSGSTKIALVSSGTQVTKSVAGTLNDLSVGTNVSVSGTANSDGSVTAQSVQIRPTGATQTGAPSVQANQ
jgi:outer membrane scaffolding protein for murein synthesis (MipA/OmpV family)